MLGYFESYEMLMLGCLKTGNVYSRMSYDRKFKCWDV